MNIEDRETSTGLPVGTGSALTTSLVIEPDGRIVYLNATLAGWLGYDLAEVSPSGLKLSDLVPGAGAALLSNLAPVPGEVPVVRPVELPHDPELHVEQVRDTQQPTLEVDVAVDSVADDSVMPCIVTSLRIFNVTSAR